MKKITFDRKLRVKKRVRSKISGSKEIPRISIFRSNKYIYGQAIDDVEKKTIVAFSSLSFKKKSKTEKIKKSDESRQVGLELGKLLQTKKIKQAVFDRSAYGYKGRVKALCEGLREAGVQI